MNTKSIFTANRAGLVACAALLATLTGCMTDGSSQRRGHYSRAAPQVQATMVVGGGYEYYPSHQVYYSRSQNEYVYREGRAWVRRPQPRGITVEALFASPSVRVNFSDSPARHHRSVVRSYPRNWRPPTDRDNDRDNRRNRDRSHGRR